MRIYRGRKIPDAKTNGNVGDLYMHIDTGDVYKCVNIDVAGKDLGFITVYTREASNVTHAWEKVTSIEDTIILVDENGVELVAVMTDEEVDLTATANDIRLGTTAVTDDGIIEGTKEIPTCHTSEGFKIVTDGSKFVLPMIDYDYTKLQAIFCLYNTSVSESVSAEKVAIEDVVYPVNSTMSESDVTKNVDKEEVDFGITNDSGSTYLIRYFSYKEIY